MKTNDLVSDSVGSIADASMDIRTKFPDRESFKSSSVPELVTVCEQLFDVCLDLNERVCDLEDKLGVRPNFCTPIVRVAGSGCQ